MLKRISALVIALLMVASVCGCGKNKEETANVNSSDVSSSQSETEVTPDKQVVLTTNMAFDKAFEDVTSKMENLGINNIESYNNDSLVNILSRNPFDMVTDGNRVYVSGGNYNDNKGPVHIYAYEKGTNVGTNCGTLTTEQVNRFYQYGRYTFAVSIDPQKWGYGELYFTENGSGEWKTVKNILKNNIHCYDMIRFKGTYFFCGSNAGFKEVDGKGYDVTKAAVFKLEGEFDDTKTRNDFSEAYAIDKEGNIINYGDDLIKKDANSEEYTSTTPRFYEFFLFDDKLFVYHYDSGNDKNNGLYLYNEEKKVFEYSSEHNAYFINIIYHHGGQSEFKIEQDFRWKDKYYFVSDGLYSTPDFKNYSYVTISGYSDYRVKDVIFRNDYALCLASKMNDDGTYTNVVVKTDDFENYTPLFTFSSDLFARSFELCDGDFYFGLGFAAHYEKDANGVTNYNKLENTIKNYDKCGTVLRLRY